MFGDESFWKDIFFFLLGFIDQEKNIEYQYAADSFYSF